MNPVQSRPTAMDIIARHSLEGCNAIVTGGAGGIGYETVRALAYAGAQVTIATRNLQAAQAAMETIKRENNRALVTVETLDLASLAMVRAFTQGYAARHQALHILINNAGIMAVPLSRTVDGHESHFGVNYLGHFALTTGLLPILEKAGNARVLSLTSIAHLRSTIVFDDIHFQARSYDPWDAYGQASTASILFGVALTERYGKQGITGNAVMPGGIMTGLQKHVPKEKQVELGWIDEEGTLSPVFKTPAEGAATAVWGALAEELEGRGGLYLQNCAIARPWTANDPLLGYAPYAVDKGNAARLWELSEKLTG